MDGVFSRRETSQRCRTSDIWNINRSYYALGQKQTLNTVAGTNIPSKINVRSFLMKPGLKPTSSLKPFKLLSTAHKAVSAILKLGVGRG